MIITAYNPTKDFKTLLALHKSQDSELATVLQPNHIPNLGMCAKQDNVMIAMGFLRLMEGPYGMLDTFVTNKGIDSQTRHMALEAITKELLTLATNLNLKAIMSYSDDVGILERAESVGFKRSDKKLIFLPL